MNSFATIMDFVPSYFKPTQRTNLRKNQRTELILTQYYPFFLKLTDSYKSIFWDRLGEVFAQVHFEFEDQADYDNFKYRLLVSAEITHYIMGQKKLTFNLPVFKMDLMSSKYDSMLGADYVNGKVMIHWDKFVEEIAEGEETGLIVVLLDQLFISKGKKLEKVLKESFLNIKEENGECRSMFNIYDVVDKNTFYKACLRSYFLFPQDLRNIHPKIFRKVDHLLFSHS